MSAIATDHPDDMALLIDELVDICISHDQKQSWDASVAALGAAAAGLANLAHRGGAGPLPDCISHAHKALVHGLTLPVQFDSQH